MMDLQNELLEQQVEQMKHQTEIVAQQKKDLQRNAKLMESLDGVMKSQEPTPTQVAAADFTKSHIHHSQKVLEFLQQANEQNVKRIKELQEMGAWDVK